ncbi:MAG: SCO family protein [Thiotrichales bacterium]|nr:SCO family protein [Thiotrichales bacterium]
MWSMSWGSSPVRGLVPARMFVALALVTLLAAAPNADASGGNMPVGGEFTLTSLAGPVNLSDHQGKVVLLFFGYTSCPDICPLSLARIGACLSSLEDEQAAQVSALFVTLDPERDTAERMGQYAGFFHPGIVGLTGDANAIDDVTARYGIPWERKAAPESALGYSISHPDTILLVDAEGTLVGEVRGEDGSEVLRSKVLELLTPRG